MKLLRYDTPANIVDFPEDRGKQAQLNREWDKNIDRWTHVAIIGDPWDLLYDHDRTGYYDPKTTDFPSGLQPAGIAWNAFPNRIRHYFSDRPPEEQWRMADEGNIPDIPDLNDPSKKVPYTPQGARGWQDEYCEWSVTRRQSDGKITRVDCTCENSEYWYTLWRVDPERVRQLYQDLVGQPVSLDDLTLKDKNRQVVIDPSTGHAAYDPLNRFNNSPTNGVVHLVSGPNTLGAEVYLAAAATLMRQGQDGGDPDSLIRCAKYGREYRNSDPHIGAQVYGLARDKKRITLTNPVGLYMSVKPDDAAKVTVRANHTSQPVPDCFTIVRGTADQGRGLHIRFEVPERLASQGLTLSDLLVEGRPVQYGAQLIDLITMQLYGEYFGPFEPQAAQPCVAPSPQPLPMMQAFLPKPIYENQFADRSLQVALTPRIEFEVPVTFVLCASNMKSGAGLQFSSFGVQAEPNWATYKVVDEENNISTVEVTITINGFGMPGDVSMQIVNPGGLGGPAMPSVLEIVRSVRSAVTAGDESAAPEAVKQTGEAAIRTTKRRPHLR